MKAMKIVWFFCGWALGMTTLSLSMGAVPSSQSAVFKNTVTDDTALYQRISEIQVRKHGDLNFDRDLERLSRMQGRYQESRLLKAPIKRISNKRYTKKR